MRKTLISLLLALPLAAADLDFKEAFADPATREVALARLVPQTRDWYFYQALNHQLAGRADAFRRTMDEWKAAAERKENPIDQEGYDTLDNRELLLRFQADPKKTAETLILRGGLKFDDAKPDARADEKLPDRLDPASITPQAFENVSNAETNEEAYRRYSEPRLLAELNKLDGFDSRKLQYFRETLRRADHPAVVALIAKVLKLPKPPAFGSARIDGLLTRAQLDELLAAVPDLRASEPFALRYLTSLLPGAETDFAMDPGALAAHLAACRDFTAILPPALNSLKAHVLYHHLRLQRDLGQYPQEDFLSYLRLPRAQHAILRIVPESRANPRIDPSRDFKAATACDPVVVDEDLVRDYLQHFLGAAETPDLFKDLIEEKQLRTLHARAQLLAGADPVKWGGALDPAEVLELQKQTRISFAPGQPVLLPAGAPVKLALDLKYTPELLVRIFELDLPSWIERLESEPTVDLDLEGLVPHHEKRIAFDKPPLLVHRELLDLPELAGPGAWVVECVSRGVASRALIRKGRLIPFIDHQARGQTVRVFDGSGNLLRDAVVARGSETFTAGDDGSILIPDLKMAKRSAGVVRQGKLAVPLKLSPRVDDISLDARFHVDREQLIADQQANLLVRLRLNSHGHEIPLEWIDKPTLKLKATLVGGAETERVLGSELKLAAKMFVPFQVPADAISLRISLTGSVTPRDGADAIPLSAEQSYAMNDILATSQVAAGFFTRDSDGYRLEVRGRNGEPLASRPLTLTFEHRDYSGQVTLPLRTDEQGKISLGTLTDIKRVEAKGVDISAVAFRPDEEAGWAALTDHLHLAAGEEIRLPLTHAMAAPDRTRISLLETRNGVLLRDHFDKLAIENRRLVLRGLPPGDYSLQLDDKLITIRVSAGADRNGLLVSAARILPRHAPGMPFIVASSIDAGSLVVRVDGATPGTRVSMIGRRYLHQWPLGNALQPFADPEPAMITPGFTGNAFLEDRHLDDEMRYIMDRRSAKTFPGSLLPRPGVLVNRWSQDDVAQVNQKGSGGGAGIGGGFGRGGSGAAPISPPGGDRLGDTDAGASIDFLASPSVLRHDLEIAADGTVQVPVADFANCQYVEVIAADAEGRHHVIFPLAPSEPTLRDRRLSRPLDAKKYHVGVRRAAALAKGAEANIEGVIDADWRAFTTLAEAHEFLAGKTSDTKLNDFRPLLEWPSLDENAKLAFLSEHACHELHLFLARKDKAFFDKHVKPMLAEKQEPTVIDDILLGRDLSGYLSAFEWRHLNAAEKALLSQAMPEARQRIATELGQRWELEAPTPEQETMLFAQTLGGKDLATLDSLGMASNDRAPEGAMAGATYLLDRLKSIVIPRIDFEDTTVEEAIEFLRQSSIELDNTELDPSRKGVGFVIRKPRASGNGDAGLDADTEGGLAASADPASLRIKELRLTNVPLAEALKYICEQTKLRYKVDDYAVTLVPATETDEDLFTRSFKVPKDFLKMLSGSGGGGSDENDPFTPGGSPQKRRVEMTEQELLTQNGVKFPEGASAKFFAGSKTLLVRNTSTNLDQIEMIVTQISDAVSDAGGEDLSRRRPYQDRYDSSSSRGLLPPVPADNEADAFAAAPPSGGLAAGKAETHVLGAIYNARPSWSSERDQTRLWSESNYYRHRGKTDESFIPLSRFWLDLATWDGKGGFISPNFNGCTHNANEVLFCLAMLDLSFKAERPETKVDGSTLRVKAREPMLLFYKETRETQKLAPDAPVLVRETFHRLDDQFRTVDGRKIENSITGDFMTGVAYEASLVVTNPTGAGRRIDVLAQIPAGAIPLDGMSTIESTTHELDPYGVLDLRLAFYFPAAGDFALYPLQVSEGDMVLARGEGRTLKVTSEAPPVDAGSWPAMARDATDAEILAKLHTANLKTLDLKLIRWRLRDAGFFHKVQETLRERLYFSPDVAAYGYFHADVAAMHDALENSSAIERLGEWLDSPLLAVRPVRHLGWETLEFDPLVNPRAHRFADKERLTLAAAAEHYEKFLDILCWKPALSAEDQLGLAAHLMMQDRIGEALARFDKIDAAVLTRKMGYDYLHAVVLFHRSQPDEAKTIAQAHAELPPGLWKERFAAVIAQANEIVALRVPRKTEEEKPKDEAPSLDLALGTDGKLLLKQHKLDKTMLQLFSVDLEVMFTKDPFLGGSGASLPGILANETREVALPTPETSVELPENFRKGNVLVAAKSGSTRVLKVLDSRALEMVRQPLDRTLQVFDTASRLPVPQCYVKVYVQGQDGEAVFHKDGYTDLRGKFDYLSHTGSELGEIRKIAVLISDPERGARIEVFDL